MGSRAANVDGYEPRTLALTAGEAGKLLHELLPDRAARVAFVVATSACWRESELARREDTGKGFATVLLRGTKRKTRFRTVPVVSPAQRSLLEYAVERAGIERCSPNDLRRTFASRQVEAGVPLYPPCAQRARDPPPFAG